MIGIIGAMQQEVDAILSILGNYEEEVKSNVKFYISKAGNKDIVICLSGIGKVNSAVATTVLFENYNINSIINIGSAGGVEGNIGDIVVAEKTKYTDVDVTVFGYAKGQVPQMPEFFECDEQMIQAVTRVLSRLDLPYQMGIVASSDSFITAKPSIEATAYEMEATSIAQVCYKYNKPFIIVRALSDIINGNNHVDFNEFLITASKNSAKIVVELINEM